MPLKTFKTREEIPEAQRSKAIELKDGFVIEELPEIDNLKSALETERTRASDAEKTLKDIKKELDDLKRQQTAGDKGVTAAELERLRNEDKEARRPLEDRIAALEKENRTLKLDDRVRQIGLDKGLMKTRVAKAMKDLEGRFELDKDGNIVVKDSEGKATKLTVEEFFEKTYREEAPFFYEGVSSSGSGAEGSGSGSGGKGYDAAAAGHAAAAAQKKASQANDLALR